MGTIMAILGAILTLSGIFLDISFGPWLVGIGVFLLTVGTGLSSQNKK